MGIFAWPFGLGIFAAFNPCGFAMLPAYLSYFLGLEGKETAQNRFATVARGLAVGVVMTLGFVAVFGTFGILFATVINQGTVLDYVPYVIITIGVLMVPLGIAMLMGKEVRLRLPKLNKGTGSRSLGSVFMFGMSYAVVSLSCTIGIFIPAISQSFATDGVATGTGNFLAYAIGMGLVITFLTMSLALAKSNVAIGMRRILPYITPFSGAMLILAGAYIIDYGIWDYQVTIAGNLDAGNLMVDQFLDFQQTVSAWITDTTTERIGLVAIFGIVGALLVGWRDDEDDPTKRLGATLTFATAYLGVEAFNRGDFIFLPIVRFVVGWPLRIAHWLTDPLRFGVPLEIAFVALMALIAWHRIDRYRPQNAPDVLSTT